MVVLAWTIGLIWGGSLLGVAILFCNAGRRSRTAATEWNPPEHPAPRRERHGLEGAQQAGAASFIRAASEPTDDAPDHGQARTGAM